MRLPRCLLRLAAVATLAAGVTSNAVAQAPPRVLQEIGDNLANLEHQDWTVRVQAAKRISQRAGVGPEYASGVAALIELLESDIDAAKQPAANALSHIAYSGLNSKTRVPELRSAVEPLEKIIDGTGEVETRRWAVIAISRIAENLGGDVVKRIIPTLIEATGDPSSDVSQWAMEGLGKYGPQSKSAVPVIIGQLEREDLRHTAVETLGNIHSDPARCMPALIAELNRPSLARERTPRQMRNPIEAKVARALGQFGPNAKQAVPSLIRLVSTDHDRIQRQAAMALAQIGPDAMPAVDALAKAFRSSGEQLTYADVAIFAALCSLGPEARERAGRLARELDSFVIGGVGTLLNNPAEVLEVLAKAPNIRTLDLTSSRLDDGQLAALSTMKQLETLSLPEQTSDEGLQHLSGLSNLQSLAHWTTYTSNSQVQEITDQGLEHLAGLRNLKRLVLWTNVTGEGLKHLRELQELRELSLRRVSDDALHHFPELPVLEKLSMGGKELTGASISKLPKLQNLRYLSLTSSCFGDAGVAALAEHHANLTELHLSMTKISPASVKDLARFQDLKVLTVYATPLAGNKHILDLSRTNAVQSLQRALPQCRVVYAD